jgi:hypothetical protein
MNKLFSLVFAIGIIAASVVAADATPGAAHPQRTAQVVVGICDAGSLPGPDGTCAPINTRYYSGRHHRYRQASHQASRNAYRVSYYYNSGYVTDADPFAPGSRRFCAFGSYVACLASGAYCLQRCY